MSHCFAARDYSDGYVGCMRALVLNGVSVDLVREVTKKPWGLYGVSVGCVGKCRSQPCLNGGKCLEGYDSFNCDCRWTPFKVPYGVDKQTLPKHTKKRETLQILTGLGSLRNVTNA